MVGHHGRMAHRCCRRLEEKRLLKRLLRRKADVPRANNIGVLRRGTEAYLIRLFWTAVNTHDPPSTIDGNDVRQLTEIFIVIASTRS